ncbi:response regulator transcription factor [Cellulomonas algicola]|uniref:helix-turn-helix transcriptional regulator n=1 Tax=Cellulomonas TaxID=1707 RepID=UPI001CECFB54|nr:MULTISPECIES: helix-turn-helix transcriptional regulator [Cellulomonas]
MSATQPRSVKLESAWLNSPTVRLVPHHPDPHPHACAGSHRSCRLRVKVEAVWAATNAYPASLAALHAAGHAAGAAEAHERARRRIEVWGDEAVDGLRSPADASRLTAREQKIARLTASGLSDEQIARRPHVSVRTVENHLGRPSASTASTTARTCRAHCRAADPRASATAATAPPRRRRGLAPTSSSRVEEGRPRRRESARAVLAVAR